MPIDYFLIKQLRQIRLIIKNIVQRYKLTPKKILRNLGFIIILVSLFLMDKNDRIIDQNNKNETVLASEVNPSDEKQQITLSNEILNGITANSYLFVGPAVLASKNETLRLPPASLTKLMTALVAVENFGLDEVVVIDRQCLNLEGNNMGLLDNERITVRSLLYGLLVFSSSDAACSLATYKTSMAEFINSMNQKASELKLYDTNFVNPIGLDVEMGDHYSSAIDILKISQEVVKNQILAEITQTKNTTVSSVDKTTFHALVNTNKLLNEMPEIKGIKTGYTNNAKECLSILYDDGERRIIGVVMGSEDRFGEAGRIVEAILKSYE